MFSASMLLVVFFEIFVAVVTILGGILAGRKYFRENRMQDFYVFMVLVCGAICDLGMLFAQIAFNLDVPSAPIGFKIFLLFILFATIMIWFHLANIYRIHSRIMTFIVSTASLLAAGLIAASDVSLAFQEGVIVPVGTGWVFTTGFVLMTAIVLTESIFATVGLKRLNESELAHFKISKISGGFFFALFICLFVFVFTRMIYFYTFTWVFAFFSMLFLFLVSMVPEGSGLVDNPFAFFRTRILFKLVITLVIMIVISLEGMAIISINISRKALSESVIESYKRVADDTVDLINRSKIDTSSEKSTLLSIARILETTKIGNRGSVFLVSKTNNVFLHRSNQWISLGYLKSPVVKQLFFGKVGGGEVDIFGEKVIAAYIPITKLKWGMIVGQPIDFAYARLKQMEATSLLFVLIWIAVTSAIGVILARGIEDPIKEVKTGIDKIGEGDLEHKIHIQNIDEIGDLAAAFNRMAGELKESQESLLRADRLTSLGYMAAGMAHEIKNALVPLKTLTDLLSVSGRDEMFIAKFNELVPHEIDRINRLSTELLHYSRPAEPQFDYCNINEIAEEAEKYLKIQAREKNVKIHLQLNSVAKIKIDRQKMLQVLTNLILNAIEAMPQKGANIWLRSRDDEEEVVLDVADDGPGVPEDKLKRIFIPFYTTKREGTGMGLAIVQKIATDHGGHIDMKSVLGEGATFSIHLPLIKY